MIRSLKETLALSDPHIRWDYQRELWNPMDLLDWTPFLIVAMVFWAVWV